MNIRDLNCVLAAVGLAAAPVWGQDPRLEERLDVRTRSAVWSAIDSARAAGIPAEPLVQKALEGASKRADGGRIVAAVRMLARELRSARDLLGASASDMELIAGAGALHAQAAPAALEGLRARRPRESLAIPLAVLADLIARGVPADTAAAAVLELARGAAGDREFIALMQNVERDISAGLPASVAVVRARGVPASVLPSTGEATGVRTADAPTLTGAAPNPTPRRPTKP